ncbi:MAG: hypothetical protein R3E31_11785 [Chloroflexota bacterium]
MAKPTPEEARTGEMMADDADDLPFVAEQHATRVAGLMAASVWMTSGIL